MRRPGTAPAAPAAAVLVAYAVLTGCVFDDDATARPSATTSARPSTSPTGSASATPASLPDARRQWHDAIRATKEEQSAKYLWSVWTDGSDEPVAVERGVFGLAPMRTAFERVVREPVAAVEDTGEYTVRVRGRGDTAYLQITDWGPWDGCWLQLTPDLATETAGLNLPDSPALPIPVVVALGAVITGSSEASVFVDPYTELAAEVSAMEAVQFLGVPPGPLLSQRDRLDRVKVPVVVGIGIDNRVKGAAAWGDDVAAALKRAHVRLPAELWQTLSGLAASVELGNFGKGAEVRLPADRFVLPPGASKQRTCPAKTPFS